MKRARPSSSPTLASVDTVDLRALSDELDLSDLMRKTVISTIDDWADMPTPTISPLNTKTSTPTVQNKHPPVREIGSPVTPTRSTPVRLWASLRRLWQTVFSEEDTCTDENASPVINSSPVKEDRPTHEINPFSTTDNASAMHSPPLLDVAPAQSTARKPRAVTDAFEDDITEAEVSLGLPSDGDLLDLCARLSSPAPHAQRRRITGNLSVDKRLANLDNLRKHIREREQNAKDADAVRQRRRQRLINEQRRLNSSLRVQRLANVPRNVKLPLPTRRARLARSKDARAAGGLSSPTGLFEAASQM